MPPAPHRMPEAASHAAAQSFNLVHSFYAARPTSLRCVYTDARLTHPTTAYGPQLGARLQLTHTQINIIGLSGNSTPIYDSYCVLNTEVNEQSVYTARHPYGVAWSIDEVLGHQ